MKHKEINTNKVPKAIGPYSQAIMSGEYIYTSGQIPIDPNTNLIVDQTIGAQAVQVLENLKNLLESSGSSLEKVVKTTIYLTDLKDFDIVNEIYSKYFKNPYPARSCIEVSALPKQSKIEIEAIAFL